MITGDTLAILCRMQQHSRPSFLNHLLSRTKAFVQSVASILNSTVANNFHCLKLILFLTFLTATAFAQNQQTISRQALFQRAYQSMAFFLYMAQNDLSFVKKLNPQEKSMLDGIYGVAVGTATFNWLVENYVERFGKPGHYFYAYTITKNRVARLPTPFEKPIGLQFSSDQKIFDLDPAQPIRSAMTETEMDKDIFVNLDLINRPDQFIDLASAVSMLLHEFAHKLDKNKIQTAVESLAGKLEDFIRSQTNTTEVNGKKISLLRFRNMPTYDQLIEDMLYGRYMGVNIPPQVHFLSSFDKQGVYAWVDDHGQITDITDAVTAPIRKNAVVQFVDQPAYNFVRHNIVLADSLTVTAAGTENFKISINSNLLQFVVPFMKTGSYDPYAFQLYDRAFTTMDSHHGGFYSYEYTVDSTNYQIKKVRPLPQTFTRPQFEVAFVSKIPKGSDLELYFTINGNRSIRLNDRAAIAELWPELKIKIGNSEIGLKAADYISETGQFKFVLKDFAQITNSKVTVVGVQMRIRDQMLVLQNSDMIAQLFLPSEVALSDGSEVKSSQKPPAMKSVQVWDGKKWTSLNKNSGIKEGMLLRFIFESTETLRELSIDQSFSVRNETTTRYMGTLIPSIGVVVEPEHRTIRFDSQDLRQNFNNGKLFVDVNIDAKVAADLNLGIPVLIDHSGVPSGGLQVGSGFTEHNNLSVEKERTLTGISFVTTSGQANDFSFRMPLTFIKPPGGDTPDDSSAVYKKLKCVLLFIN